jgi:hypothetical protein
MKLPLFFCSIFVLLSCSKTQQKTQEFESTVSVKQEEVATPDHQLHSRSGFSAYNLNTPEFKKDLNRVLDQVAGLQSSRDTKLGGRKGQAKGGFNEGFSEGFSMAGNLGGGSGSISPSRGVLKVLARSSIAPNDNEQNSAPIPITIPQNLLKRSVTYEAHLVQSTRTPEKLLNTVDSILIRMGGQILQRGNAAGFWKIPADSLNKALQIIEPLGKIIDKSLQSSDLTDQVQETALRLKFLKLKVAKLKELVAQAQNTSDKLRLLQELEEAHYALSSLENEQIALQDLIAYSRISLDLVPPQSSENQSLNPIRAFEWIRNLSPQNRNYAVSQFKWPTPPGMILLNAQILSQNAKNAPINWQVTSASGVSLWAHNQNNNPLGDTLFWTKALVDHFKERCKTIQEEHLDKVIKIRCESYDIEPYIYWISLSKKSTQEHSLTLIEAYFPSLAEESKFRKSLNQFWKEVSL